MQISYGYGFIDTKRVPFGDDKELIACCRRCEAYGGEEHDFRDCYNCPTLSLYKNYVRLRFDAWRRLGRR